MLTRLEERLLQFITRHIAQSGHGPTLTEMGVALGINSKGTIHRYIEALIEKGYVHRSGRGWRSIRLTGKHDRRLTILPLAGRMAEGRPIEAIADEKEINFSALLLGPGRYVLRVLGNAMVDAGIIEDDLVIVKQAVTANDGDIVLALIDEEETVLKRLKKHPNRIELLPANPAHASMIYPAERVHIQGIVIGQVRLY